MVKNTRNFKITNRITERNSESLRIYFDELRNIEAFDDDDEQICATLAATGDTKAKDRLILKNLRFVVSVAKSYVSNGVLLEDLINEGNEGLIMAANKFDHTKGVKFISYAVWWIRRYILFYIATNAKTIRVPNNKLDELAKLKKQLIIASQKLGREAHVNDLIDDSFSRKDIELISGLSTLSNVTVTSLSSTINDSNSGDDILFGDVIADDSFGNPDDNLHSQDMTKMINIVLDKLTPKEKIVMTALYGLNGSRQLTLEECSQLDGVNVSREMVRHIKVKALKKCKVKLSKLQLN